MSLARPTRLREHVHSGLLRVSLRRVPKLCQCARPALVWQLSAGQHCEPQQRRRGAALPGTRLRISLKPVQRNRLPILAERAGLLVESDRALLAPARSAPATQQRALARARLPIQAHLSLQQPPRCLVLHRLPSGSPWQTCAAQLPGADRRSRSLGSILAPKRGDLAPR